MFQCNRKNRPARKRIAPAEGPESVGDGSTSDIMTPPPAGAAAAGACACWESQQYYQPV